MSYTDGEDWEKCCKIIDKLTDIGDENILGSCVTMLCANIKEAQDLVIGQYQEVLDDDEY